MGSLPRFIIYGEKVAVGSSSKLAKIMMQFSRMSVEVYATLLTHGEDISVVNSTGIYPSI